MPSTNIIPIESIEKKILFIRGQKVMLDKDLAELYGVDTKTLKRSVKRNIDRFPEDFMFELTSEEQTSLRYHFGTSNIGRGGTRYLPFAFTEQGVAMLSSVLRSKRATQVNIAIMRAFVRLRELFATQKDIAAKFAELEKRIDKNDAQIKNIFEAIRQLIQPPEKPKRPMGFEIKEQSSNYGVKRRRQRF